MNHRRLYLLGERDPAKLGHAGIEASIDWFQRKVDATLKLSWISTSEITSGSAATALADATSVWCVPGSPYASTSGALAAIRFARERKLAFLGTCGGFQHALMEYAQDVLGHGAEHQELTPEAEHPLIAKLSCSLVEAKAMVRSCAPEYAKIVGAEESHEEFHCNYGLSPDFEGLFAGSELRFIARDDSGQIRAFKLQNHPFFMGTLFQPERKALSGEIHPLVHAFLKMA